MKKNYFEPVIKVQTIALQSMMTTSGDGQDTEMGIDEGSTDDDAPVKGNILDGLFD